MPLQSSDVLLSFFVLEVPQIRWRQKQSPDSVPRVWKSPLLSELLLPG